MVPLRTCRFRVALLDGLEDALGCEHAALHRRVRPLDLGHVHEPGAAAGEAAAGERQLGDALEAALVQGAGAVSAKDEYIEISAELLFKGCENVAGGEHEQEPNSHPSPVLYRVTMRHAMVICDG